MGSILNMLKKVGAAARISSDPGDLASADKIILPGVGAFDQGAKSLRQRGFVAALNKRVIGDSVPLLGICLGMQLLGESSEEGEESGLGWVKAYSARFIVDKDRGLTKVPHMGWNEVNFVRKNVLFKDFEPDGRYYFVHSYHVVCEEPQAIVTTTRYGVPFVSSIQKGNIFGVQFHPEKSHRYGMQLLRNFAEYA